MYRYLLVPSHRNHFLAEEPSGRTLHQAVRFLRLLRRSFPEVVVEEFVGRVCPPALAGVDLALLVPPGPGLLGHLIEGFITIVINRPEPGARLRSPGDGFRIELDNRGQRAAEVVAGGEGRLPTASRTLLALVARDRAQTEWLRGTSSKRKATRQRWAFFLDRPEDPEAAVRSGRLWARKKPLPE